MQVGWVLRYLLLLPVLLLGACSSSRLEVRERDPSMAEAEEADTGGGGDLRPRGFNLLSMFNAGTWQPFEEDDFRLIAELGFNFVRLPLDYRCWIRDNDWRKFNEQALQELDKAVRYARGHGLHVCLNFHRAPGYTVSLPEEEYSLWTDAEALEACTLHWETLAERYKDVPPEAMSFNLLNEPAGVDERTYVRVVNHLASAIRSRDRQRPIVVDGLDWGKKPPNLPFRFSGLVYATRGYLPMRFTHYKAPWVEGSEDWSVPAWPWPRIPGFLYGPSRGELHGALRLMGPFPGGTRIRLRVAQVSDTARLRIYADSVTVLDRVFLPGDGDGEWEKVVYRPEWDVYQNLYDLELSVELEEPAACVDLESVAGDWVRLASITVDLPGADEAAEISLTDEWGRKPPEIRVDAGAGAVAFRSDEIWDRQWLWDETVAPWLPLQRRGARVMVGEFGAHNRVPHAAVLRWMRDSLENWKMAGWGWALWNFSGPFGIFDSGRDDVQYETFQGRKLDRKMLDLLLEY